MYFDNVTDSELKNTYRRYAQTMHPDRGGSETEFKEMKRQYEYRLQYGKNQETTPTYKTTVETVNLYITPQTCIDLNWKYRHREDARTWVINLEPQRENDRISLTLQGVAVKVVSIEYRAGVVIIVAKETRQTKHSGMVTAELQSESGMVVFGEVDLSVKDIESGKVKFDLDDVRWYGKQLDLRKWNVEKYRIIFHKMEEKQPWLSKIVDWFTEKLLTRFKILLQ